MEARFLEAAVDHGVHHQEGEDEEEPEDKRDAEHQDEHVLGLPRIVQAAEHHLHLDAHGGVGDDQEDGGGKEEDKVEELLGVISFLSMCNNCACLGVLL